MTKPGYTYSPSTKKWIKVKTLDTDAKPSKRRQREVDLFIRVPLKRLEEVSKAVRPRSAVIWIILLHMAWLAQSSSFVCTNGLMGRFGIDRHAKYRALAELEAAGFITVKPQTLGRSLLVTLIGD
jgi:hypothetical protein